MIVPFAQLRYYIARNRAFIIALSCALSILYYLHTKKPPYREHVDSTAANNTLGFGAIYVLTEDATTWRVQGLRAAADLLGLKLTIPIQRRADDDRVARHLQGDKPNQVLDEIRTVLNYLSLLDTFIKSGLETALFLEDDADFGLPIRSQMRAIARSLLAHYYPGENSRAGDNEALLHMAHRDYPYGAIDSEISWEVLWIGHYGMEWTNQTEIWRYDDTDALPWTHLTCAYNDYYERFLDPDAKPEFKRQQIVHRAAPIATYAFALTRGAAQKIVQKFRTKHVQKFDYDLHRMCKGLELLCTAPIPEVVHHHKVVGQRSMNEVGTVNEGKQDINWWRNRHKFTYNVEWSARCNAAGVGERIGDRWQCMPGKYDPCL